MDKSLADKETDAEVNFAYALLCVACLLGIIITMEVVTINDRRRLDDFLIQQHELQEAQSLREIAAGRCFAAAMAQGLDFVQVCPAWVYDN